MQVSDVKPMSLSTAIRLGAMLRPQAFGDLFRDGKSCALGAAYESNGLMDPATDRTVAFEEYQQRTREAFPILKRRASCPICGGVIQNVALSISHLNDDHRLTREAIADWVAGLEAAQAHDQPPSTNAVDPSAQPQESEATRA